MKNLTKILFLFCITLFSTNFVYSQGTYKIGATEYYIGKYYTTTGKPMVKRSSSNKRAFLNSLGYTSAPDGYDVDHIVPLFKGGTDHPSNMQLLPERAHNAKTARERSNSSYYKIPSYKAPRKTYSRYVSPTPNYGSFNFNSGSSRTIHTGPRGGKYYINSNGNKSYVKQ